MGFQDIKSGFEQALGNVKLPRIINPTIRSSNRRHDPDGLHASPYYSGLNGTTLSLSVTPVGTVNITFVSDFLVDAITTINAASPANLAAADDDGYLRVTNLNGGNRNSLTVLSGTSLTILGLVSTPESGSISVAGEISTASSGRGLTSNQSNPQGTYLLGQDEDLSTSSINRSIFGSVLHAERILRDLDKEIPVVRKYSVTVSTQPITGNKIFVINDSTLRIPVDGFGLTTSNPGVFLIDQLVRVKTANDIDFLDISQSEPVPQISGIFYNDGSVGVADTAHTFVAWGTPDGKSIFGSQLINKQAPVNIVAIRGNIIQADTALFQTNVVQPGDTVVVEAANNNTPFNHNGEFVVTEVIDEKRIGVRAKALGETGYTISNKPTELNTNLPGGTSYGTVRVIVGGYLPGSHLTFQLPSWVTNGTSLIARVLCGVRVRDLIPGDLGSVFSPNNEGIADILYKHITNATSGFRHHAADVDALAVAGAPNALGSGTVATQLAALLGFLNTLIAGEVSYGGGGNWADGTTNPATTVESQLDKIISDLAGSTGTAKIKGSAVGGDLIAETLALQITDLVNNWLKLSRNNAVTGQNTFSALQILNGLNAAGFSIGIDTPPDGSDIPKPIWYAVLDTAAGIKLRCYSMRNTDSISIKSGGIFFTVNAAVTGRNTLAAGHPLQYIRDSATWTGGLNADACRLFAAVGSGALGTFEFDSFAAHTTATWEDTNWTRPLLVSGTTLTVSTLSAALIQNTGNRFHTEPIIINFASSGAFSSTTADGAGSFTFALAAAGSVGYMALRAPSNNALAITQVIVENSGLITGTGNATYDLWYGDAGNAVVPASILSAPVSSSSTAVSLVPNGGTHTPSSTGYYILKITVPGTGTYSYYSVRMTYSGASS